MKRKLLSISIVIIMLAVLSSGTFAYHTVENTARNVITSGSLELTLHETAADGSDFPAEGVAVMPGDVISKIVTVENSGDHPFYLRLQVSKSVTDGSLSAEKCLALDINTEDWTYRDGYYYYNTLLQPGETTAPLFTQVEIVGKQVSNAYLGKTMMVEVTASAVQSEHNGGSVWEAAGWPAD